MIDFYSFLAFYFVFITGVFVGMLVGYTVRPKQKHTADAEIIDHSEKVETKPVDMVMSSPTYYNRQIEGDAEIIERPDAKRLVELEEDETIRAGKAATAETLKKFPSVREILEAKDAFIKGI